MIDSPVPETLELQLVVFRLGVDHYAIPVAHVSRIIPLQKITTVPRAPAFVEGVTDLVESGHVIPVMDLRKRFDIQPAEESRCRIIVAEQADKLIGLLVDSVDEVLTVPRNAIEPPNDLVVSVDSQFLAGIVRLEDRLIILLDQDLVLNPSESRQLASLKVGGKRLDELQGADPPQIGTP